MSKSIQNENPYIVPGAGRQHPCPPWCVAADEPDHAEPMSEVGAGRVHCTEGEVLIAENEYGIHTSIRGTVEMWVVSDEMLNADGTTTSTAPLVRMMVGSDEVMLSVEQLRTVREMCGRAADTLAGIERKVSPEEARKLDEEHGPEWRKWLRTAVPVECPTWCASTHEGWGDVFGGLVMADESVLHGLELARVGIFDVELVRSQPHPSLAWKVETQLWVGHSGNVLGVFTLEALEQLAGTPGVDEDLVEVVAAAKARLALVDGVTL